MRFTCISTITCLQANGVAAPMTATLGLETLTSPSRTGREDWHIWQTMSVIGLPLKGKESKTSYSLQ